MQQACELDRGVGVGELRADRRREMLDVGDLDDRRLLGRRHPHRERAQRAGDPAGDDRLLGTLLGRAQQLLTEVVVDGGVGVVRDSDPAAEMAETEIKLGALLPILAG